MRRRVRPMRMRNVHRVKSSSGRTLKYHRVTRAPLPADVHEDHPAFIAAWYAEETRGVAEERKPTKPGTVRAGCEAYLRSTSFDELSGGYRPVIGRHVKAISEQGAKAMMRDLMSHHITADLAALKPAVANSRRKAWRKLCDYWMARGWIKSDPSDGVRSKRMPKSDGHREWQHEDLQTFREYWGMDTPQRLACELLQWTGARCVDCVKLGPGMVRANGLLTFTQQKTGVAAMVPWTSTAFGFEADRADLLKLTEKSQMVFILTNYGRPRSVKAFSQWFSGAATKAGLPDLSAHGLRKYRMNRLAEGGATILQMQAWVGHTTLFEVEQYTQRANRITALTGGQSVNGAVPFTKSVK